MHKTWCAQNFSAVTWPPGKTRVGTSNAHLCWCPTHQPLQTPQTRAFRPFCACHSLCQKTPKLKLKNTKGTFHFYFCFPLCCGSEKQATPVAQFSAQFWVDITWQIQSWTKVPSESPTRTKTIELRQLMTEIYGTESFCVKFIRSGIQPQTGTPIVQIHLDWWFPAGLTESVLTTVDPNSILVVGSPVRTISVAYHCRNAPRVLVCDFPRL